MRQAVIFWERRKTVNRIIIGITGASGSIYAKRLIEELHRSGAELHIICSETGLEVFGYETGNSLPDFINSLGNSSRTPLIHENSNLFAPTASGSFRADGMVIVPCSMATLGGMASGSLQSLLGRTAAVCLKERRKLIIVPRETPLNRINLKGMLELDEAGAVILPAMPGFYNRPETVEDVVDFTVSRILDQLGVDNSLSKRWAGR